METIPRSYLYKKEVECPWSEKGTVMRRLIEDAKQQRVELIDGVKIYADDGWTLVLPDCEEPVFKVVTEASTSEAAERLAEHYTGKIERYQQDRAG